MTRLVSVRYLVPVFATVDLDAEAPEGSWYPDEAVTRVFQADESITRLDDEAGVRSIATGPVLDTAIEDEEHAIDPDLLSDEDQAKAIEIAETTVWPAWERG